MSGGAMYLYGWVLAPEEQGGTGCAASAVPLGPLVGSCVQGSISCHTRLSQRSVLTAAHRVCRGHRQAVSVCPVPLLVQEPSLTLQTEAGGHWGFCSGSRGVREPRFLRPGTRQRQSFGVSVGLLGLPGSDGQGFSVDDPVKANAQTGAWLLYKENFSPWFLT